MAVPYTFATATASIPLSQLDSNFATGITLGNTTVYLGNTTTSIGNLTLTNATISSVASTFPNSYLANSSVTIGSTSLSLGGTATTITGLTITGSTFSGTSVTDSGLTSGRVTYATTGGLLTDSANMTFNGTTFTLANDASISGLTVGKGGGAIATNTALGVGALTSNTTASNNTAVGYQAGYSNTTGYQLDAIGGKALYSNTTGNTNSAFGFGSLYTNTTGSNNAGYGNSALYANTTGSNNTAVGQLALQANTTASNNTAVGYQAGYSNTTGVYNVYFGQAAGYSATTGTSYSCFIGAGAGQNTTGTQNHFFGQGAGQYVTSGAKNVILGGYGGNQGGLDIRTSSNNIVLSDGDGTPRLISDTNGNFYGGSDNAYSCGNSSHRWTAVWAVNGSIQTSDEREKTDIVDSPLGLDFICKVRPVAYKFKVGKNQISFDEDGNQVVTPIAGTRQHFGVLAQQVKQSLGDVDFGGWILTDLNNQESAQGVRYDEFVSPLIKAIQELKAEIDLLKAK